MIVIDTSAIIRFSTEDDDKKALKVKNLFESDEKIIIPEVVFPELEYVLKRAYKLKKNYILTIFLLSYFT